MKRALEALVVLVAVAASTVLFLPHLRRAPEAHPRPSGGGATFHAGKAPAVPPANGCAGEGCHGAAPHLAGPSLAAFLNLHSGKVECLACHGADGRKGWKAGEGGHRLSSSLPPVTAANRHGGVVRRGPACRDCHSRDGEEALRRAGAALLPPSFADPMALRMLEGGARKW